MSERADGHPVVKVTRDYLTKFHNRVRERLPMWVVYNTHTREYPGSWVARLHVTLPEPRPTRFVATHDSLESLREILPPGLTRLPRDVNDLPEIVETWF